GGGEGDQPRVRAVLLVRGGDRYAGEFVPELQPVAGAAGEPGCSGGFARRKWRRVGRVVIVVGSGAARAGAQASSVFREAGGGARARPCGGPGSTDGSADATSRAQYAAAAIARVRGARRRFVRGA